MRISVVIPAFNEASNIASLIEETFAAVPATALGEFLSSMMRAKTAQARR